jgi:hypothetical protein
VKEVALLWNMQEYTVAKRLRQGKPVLGIHVKFIKEPGRGAPYRIHRDSFEQLQRMLTSRTARGNS